MSEATPNVREARRMLGKGIVIAGVGETEQGKLEGRGPSSCWPRSPRSPSTTPASRWTRSTASVTAFSFVEATLMHATTFADYLGMEPGLLRLGRRRRGDRAPDGGAGRPGDRRGPGRDGALRARRQHPLGHQLLGDDRDGARDEPRRLRGPLRPDHDRRLRAAGPALHVRARRAPGGAGGGRGHPVRARGPEVERDAARRGQRRGRHERPLDRDPVPRHGLLAASATGRRPSWSPPPTARPRCGPSRSTSPASARATRTSTSPRRPRWTASARVWVVPGGGRWRSPASPRPTWTWPRSTTRSASRP